MPVVSVSEEPKENKKKKNPENQLKQNQNYWRKSRLLAGKVKSSKKTDKKAKTKG